jgi:hypothetical protein
MSALENDKPEFRVVKLADGTEVDLSMEEFWEQARKEKKSSEELHDD